MSSSRPAAEDEPQSVEEAGALLGASINRYGATGSSASINPPKGTHSSFSVLSPVPSSELFTRLHSLRGLLRSAPRDVPLVAAPSLLAGALMKLLGISSNLASAIGSNADQISRVGTPPLMSTPIRKLWVDCVVLCHTLGEGLSGNSRINIFGFVKQMIQLAAMNPRAARAAGGTRIAALEVICALLKEQRLAKQLSTWALDVIQLCQRALKSSGNGEPSYRIAAIQTAKAAAISSRLSFLGTRPGSNPLVLKGALEDKAILEMVKLLKTATADKYPEIREGAASLASILAPLVIHTSIKSPNTPDAAASDPLASLEEVMAIAFKNLDDQSPAVAAGWAEALARCMATSIEFHTLLNAEKTNNRNVEEDGTSPHLQDTTGGVRGGRKGVLSVKACSTLPKALQYLVRMFVKMGGEWSAVKGGSTFSVGGRSVRNGLARTLIHLLRLQTNLETLGEGKSISYKDAILTILEMVGNDMEAQLSGNTGPSPANNIFGQGPKVSPADVNLTRHATSRVLREGITELLSETTQITILYEFINLCDKQRDTLRGGQLQVILIEISHLLAILGEACTSSLDDLMPGLEKCLRHSDQGVRHEAAIACAAMASVAPARARLLVKESISGIQMEHAELLAVTRTQSAENKTETPAAGRFARFRRQAAPVKEAKVDESSKCKHAIHGLALTVAVLLRDLPSLPEGLPIELMDTSISVAEILVNTMFNDNMTANNPGGVCTCVRSGFGIISGALATGTSGITKHLTLIFGLWQKVSKEGQRGGNFADVHELVCIDALLQSTVAFLRYCSELLLSVPEALSKTSLLLEDILPLLFETGRLGKARNIPVAVLQGDSAKAAILEAFSWLPPGSYPMVADSVFSFAASNIQAAIEKDVPCSILRSLVSKEDEILDATSFCRAVSPGQVGAARDLENDLIAITCETASHNEREAAIHFLKSTTLEQPASSEFLKSEVLGLIVEDSPRKAPTALHEVGTWRQPAEPSCSARVRLVDASIQAFAATFTLKSGREQQAALQMLESLLTPAHLQPARSTITDQGRRAKLRDESAASVNIAAVLLSCLRALPVLESTHNVPINLGPMWMNKAKDVLLQILSSQSSEVRRAAAEGLGFLSTLGVREDARFLQSAVLHSLDEVIQGTQSQEPGKQLTLETISAGRSAAVLALACMQRTAFRIKKERRERTRERGGVEQNDQSAEDILPLFQILIKVLPSIAIRSTGGFLEVRTFGLHAFGLLFSYSKRLEAGQLSEQDRHLLFKVVELIEDNLLSAWTAASADFDHGTDADKLSSEAAFVAVLLRLMTFVTPSLTHLEGLDTMVASRFSRMATISMDCYGSHPVVRVEAMAFYEVLSQHMHLLPPHLGGVKYDEHPVLCCIPMLMESMKPQRAEVHPNDMACSPRHGYMSPTLLQAALKVIRSFALADIPVADWSDLRIVSLLYTALDELVGTACFGGNTHHRNLAAPRESEPVYKEKDTTPTEVTKVMYLLLTRQRSQSRNCLPILLRYMLLSRCVLVGAGTRDEDVDEENPAFSVAGVIQAAINHSISDAKPVLEYTSSVRWQVKELAVQVMAVALTETAATQMETALKDTIVFNPRLGVSACEAACRKAAASGSTLPDSMLSLHIGAIVTAACATATSTVDQAELRSLQRCAMQLLTEVIKHFGNIPDPDQSSASVLNEYIPQISSSIKNALTAPVEENGAQSCHLFFVGCETLEMFLKQKVTSDQAVLKRIVRPAILSPEELLSITSDPQKKDAGSKFSSGTRSGLLIPIGKLLIVGTILSVNSELMAMVEADSQSIGLNAAAMAMDGAMLLLSTGLSLCGKGMDRESSHPFEFGAGSFISKITDIDDTVKAVLAQKWAALGATAVALLAPALTKSRKNEVIEIWLKKLVPFLFVGFDDALDAKSNSSLDVQKDWVRSLNTDVIASACLQGITHAASTKKLLELDSTWTTQVERAVSQISKYILEPIVRETREYNESDYELLKVSCGLLLKLRSNTLFCKTENSSVLLSILRPISAIQGATDLGRNKEVDLVFSSCLTAVASIIPGLPTPAPLAKALVATVLNIGSTKELPPQVQGAIRVLLKECISLDSISSSDRSDIATVMATCKDWETWSVVVQVESGINAMASLGVVKSVLLDANDCAQQIALLSTLRNILQTTPPPNDFTGRIVCSIGVEIFSVFQAYGTLTVPTESKQHRTAICADGMKIALVAIQQFVADGTTEDDLSKFLLGFFQCLISVLKYNGLPNHPAPNPGSSDPAVGRMCAQAITHVARIAPAAFKMSMTLMSESDRTVLEFAVRAEMSGYVNAAQAPAKKKLSLKGFKK